MTRRIVGGPFRGIGQIDPQYGGPFRGGQNQRLLPEGYMSAYGEVHAQAGTTVTVLPNTFVKMGSTTTLGAASNFDMPQNNRLRYTGTPTVDVHVCAHWSNRSTTAVATLVRSQLSHNGTLLPNSESNAGQFNIFDTINLAPSLIVNMATNDYIELWIAASVALLTFTTVGFNLRAVALHD